MRISDWSSDVCSSYLIDECYEQTLARKIEFGDRPGCGKAKKHVERYADGRDQKGEPDGGQRIGFDDRGGECLYAVLKRLGKHSCQGEQPEQADEQQIGRASCREKRGQSV